MKRTSIAAVLLVLAVLLAGCGGAGDEVETETPIVGGEDETETPIVGGDNETETPIVDGDNETDITGATAGSIAGPATPGSVAAVVG